MNLLSWIVIGIACGWGVSALRGHGEQWTLLNILLSCLAGVAAGRWMLPGPDAFNMQWQAFEALAAAVSCAVALLAALLLGWMGTLLAGQASGQKPAGRRHTDPTRPTTGERG